MSIPKPHLDQDEIKGDGFGLIEMEGLLLAYVLLRQEQGFMNFPVTMARFICMPQVGDPLPEATNFTSCQISYIVLCRDAYGKETLKK